MQNIATIHDLNKNSVEGKLLMAAIILLSNESLVAKAYDDVLAECVELAKSMYGIQEPKPEIAY